MEWTQLASQCMPSINKPKTLAEHFVLLRRLLFLSALVTIIGCTQTRMTVTKEGEPTKYVTIDSNLLTGTTDIEVSDSRP